MVRSCGDQIFREVPVYLAYGTGKWSKNSNSKLEFQKDKYEEYFERGTGLQREVIKLPPLRFFFFCLFIYLFFFVSLEGKQDQGLGFFHPSCSLLTTPPPPPPPHTTPLLSLGDGAMTEILLTEWLNIIDRMVKIQPKQFIYE